MNGVEAIIAKILDDATSKSKEIVDNANNLANEKIKDAKDWAKNYTDAQTEILNKESAEIVRRRLTNADLDCRKISLQGKQDLINSCLDLVYKKICKIDKKDYLKLVEKNIELFADDGDKVVLSCDKVLSQDDVKSLKIVKDKNLTIDNSFGDFIGGVKLIGKNSDKDLTFKSIIESNKDEYVTFIADKLFN